MIRQGDRAQTNYRKSKTLPSIFQLLLAIREDSLRYHPCPPVQGCISIIVKEVSFLQR